MSTQTDNLTAVGLVARALGLELETESQLSDFAARIPDTARFDIRRDVEYLADEYCHPNYAAPRGAPRTGWLMSGDEDALESYWSGQDQLVRAYRWDCYAITLAELETLAQDNFWDVQYGDVETLAGYLDVDSDGIPRMFPACQVISDGMDWNQGGWTPVYIVADYIVVK